MPHRDVRAAASGSRHLEPAWPLGRRREPATVILRPEARRDVRRAAVRPGGLAAVPRASGSPSVRGWSPGQVRSGAPQARPSEQGASPWAQAVPQDPPQGAAEASETGVHLSAVWVRAAAEPPREAVPAAWEPGVLQAVSGHAAAALLPAAVRAASALRPAAAKVASGQQAAGVAAAEPGGPQVVAKAAALPGAAVRPPAEALQADEVQPRVAVWPVAQAAWPLAVPSEAASVFRQGQSLVAGPAQPRAAAHFAHAMRSLRIASRSEPSLQAARNEGWSWW